MPARIELDRERVALFCRQHHIRKMALFGSVLRADFRPDSDMDVVIEFEPGHGAGFLGLSSSSRSCRGCWAVARPIW